MVVTESLGSYVCTLDDGNRWRAVLARDTELDGSFVYAVRSTGIYCRPSCPSRRPQRRQVSFYPVPEAAERAGFRPCRRCRSNLAPSPNPETETVRRACRYIMNATDRLPTLDELSTEAGLSPSHLWRVFKRVMGITPYQYADACRLGTLKTGLKNGQTVTDALYASGYGSSSRLYERSSAQLGMTPQTYRHGGKNQDITYSVASSPVGHLLVAATERGICTVRLGDVETDLEADLRREYTDAEIVRDDTVLKEWIEVILQGLSGLSRYLRLPLDIRGTAFERLVWEELRRIPFGETRSYSEIAEELGQPGAARAVGRACGANPVALIIPCHRAVRKDGSIGGYRWGVERKEALLAQERPAAMPR